MKVFPPAIKFISTICLTRFHHLSNFNKCETLRIPNIHYYQERERDGCRCKFDVMLNVVIKESKVVQKQECRKIEAVFQIFACYTKAWCFIRQATPAAFGRRMMMKADQHSSVVLEQRSSCNNMKLRKQNHFPPVSRANPCAQYTTSNILAAYICAWYYIGTMGGWWWGWHGDGRVYRISFPTYCMCSINYGGSNMLMTMMWWRRAKATYFSPALLM